MLLWDSVFKQMIKQARYVLFLENKKLRSSLDVLQISLLVYYFLQKLNGVNFVIKLLASDPCSATFQ